MCKTQFLKYFSEESCKNCPSIQKADECVEFDECSEHSSEYFKAGFTSAKQEYEEKHRWIPFTEKMPDVDPIIQCKKEDKVYYSGIVKIKFMTSEEKTKELISQFGDNAKYVVLEVKEELKQLYKDLGLEHEEQKNYMIRVLNYWSRVKEAIEKKSKSVEIDISKDNSFTHKC